MPIGRTYLTVALDDLRVFQVMRAIPIEVDGLRADSTAVPNPASTSERPGTRRDGQVSYGTRRSPLRAAAVRP